MLLCGGGALHRGLPQRLRAETGLPVHLAEEPLRCVVHGAGAAVEQPELLSREAALYVSPKSVLLSPTTD